MEDNKILCDNIDKLYTTEMRIDRIKKNLNIDTSDVVEYCKNKVKKMTALSTNKVKTGIVKLTI